MGSRLSETCIHGYRISQLFSAQVDPGEILKEYRTTRFPERFFNLKIGIPWADREHRVDLAQVLALCGDEPMLERSDEPCSMGVDTGKDLHIVILQDTDDSSIQRLVHLAICHTFADLGGLLNRFRVDCCVIDGLPETHATREFASHHRGRVFLNFFNQHERGAAKWDLRARTVQINRTEALDASRRAVRDKLVQLPRQQAIVEEFARHMANDAKILDEDEETGIKKFRYVRTGEDHFSLAFTYGWLAAASNEGGRGWMRYMRMRRRER